jgi:hypothetical protein
MGKQLDTLEKIVYSLENIKHLDSGRKIVVEGMA